jgi:hypothetical protein
MHGCRGARNPGGWRFSPPLRIFKVLDSGADTYISYFHATEKGKLLRKGEDAKSPAYGLRAKVVGLPKW